MISHRSHALLSEVHRILSEFSADEFRNASAFSEQLKDALLLLSNKVGKVTEIAPTASEETPRNQVSVRNRARGEQQKQYSNPEEVENFLRRLGAAESAQTLENINQNFDLGLAIRPKDGRERALKRVAKAIAFSSQSRRSRIISSLSKESKSQTQGWIEVIKGSK